VEFLGASPASAAAHERPALWISKSAVKLTPGSDDALVFTVSEGQAVARRVRIGTRGDKSVQVTEGLTEGMEIVAENADQLKDGAAVRVMRRLESFE
jgi:multidrug efflux pump subunit AcrA (membrane-fusion protein)